MIVATFTAHTLPILANWSQFLGSLTLLTGVTGAYLKHRCHEPGCVLIGRHRQVDGSLVCHLHRRAV